MNYGPRWYVVAGLALALPAAAAQFRLPPHTLTVPEGFEVELVAGPPLVLRPMMADFDEQGRLYVADSSGSNDKVEKQLEAKPHRIVRLEDTEHDDEGREVLVVFCPRTEMEHRVPVVMPDEERAQKIQDELVQLLFGGQT